jgi:mutator protein MutT
MKERNKAVPASYVFLRKGDEILLMRRANTGYQDGTYIVPSGHVEAGELPRAALVREIKEEIGIDVVEGDLSFALVLYRPAADATGDRVCFFYNCEQWTGEIINAEPNKCDELRWSRLDQLPENVTPHVRAVIEAMARGKSYLELDIGWLKEHQLYFL